jgi:hypothetical protein
MFFDWIFRLLEGVHNTPDSCECVDPKGNIGKPCMKCGGKIMKGNTRPMDNRKKVMDKSPAP